MSGGIFVRHRGRNMPLLHPVISTRTEDTERITLCCSTGRQEHVFILGRKNRVIDVAIRSVLPPSIIMRLCYRPTDLCKFRSALWMVLCVMSQAYRFHGHSKGGVTITIVLALQPNGRVA